MNIIVIAGVRGKDECLLFILFICVMPYYIWYYVSTVLIAMLTFQPLTMALHCGRRGAAAG